MRVRARGRACVCVAQHWLLDAQDVGIVALRSLALKLVPKVCAVELLVPIDVLVCLQNKERTHVVHVLACTQACAHAAVAGIIGIDNLDVWHVVAQQRGCDA